MIPYPHLMRYLITVLLFAAGVSCAFATRYSIHGFIHDMENDRYLAAATVSLMPNELHVQADNKGYFSFEELPPGNYMLSVRFIGYDDLHVPLLLSRDTLLHLHLTPSRVQLQAVIVSANNNDERTIIAPLPVEEIGRGYLLRHNAANFVQSLSSLPGLASMDIGAGFSKPVIRGLGFNRVAVVDRGIVQQNQQWGADHGLEIDQYDVDRARVHKGPMSLFHGSDAIGGVIEVLPPFVPDEDMFRGEASLIAKGNNSLFGASVMVSRKRGDWFTRARATIQDYGDYRVPTDTIEYLTWKMPVHGRRMKNTAGREANLSFSVHREGENGKGTWLHLSNVNAKNGFFPGSHGIPSLPRLEPDGSTRNIEHPYAASNHFKLVLNRERRVGMGRLKYDLGYQQNRREERSGFHTHYGSQIPPAVDPDLELRFVLNTLSGNVRWSVNEEERWSKDIGFSTEYQHNRVGGYSFLLPEFDRFTAGAFWLNRFTVNDRLQLTGGIRYDAGRLRVEGFRDQLLDDYLQRQGYDEEVAGRYAQRAADLQRTFGDFSGSVGVQFTPNPLHSWKVNLGKSFRYPSANELASNGVHHGAFRHEQGNSSLQPERGYQLDMEYQYSGSKWRLAASPFFTYFSNYIFLEPSGEWSVLPHAGQVYAFRQSKAMIAGGEVSAEYEIDRHWRVSSSMEYVYNRNLDDHYPLPFSPPTVIDTELAYTSGGGSRVTYYELRLENRWVMAQDRIARNEERTPGTNLWSVAAHLHWQVAGRRVVTDLRVDNLFDRAFLNHLSFYRKMNAPEPGRNVQLVLRIPF